MLYILYNFHLFLGDWTLAIPYTRPLYSLSRGLVGAPLVVPELFGLACGFSKSNNMQNTAFHGFSKVQPQLHQSAFS